MKYYRVMEQPKTNWMPYCEEPIYDEAPWVGTYITSAQPRNPAPGDFLIVTGEDYVVEASCSDNWHDGTNYFSDVLFHNKPSLEALLLDGTVKEVTEDEKYREDSYYLRIASLRKDIELTNLLIDDTKNAISTCKSELQIDGVVFRFHTDDTIKEYLEVCMLELKLNQQCKQLTSVENELRGLYRREAL